MELDGYSEELQLAFEHHGNYHFEIDGRYSIDNDSLVVRQRRDAEKRDLCKKQGVALIEIPEVPSRLKLNALHEFISVAMASVGRSLTESQRHTKINLIPAYKPAQFYFKLSQRAESMGGRLLSDHYVAKDAPLDWSCSKGHTWTSSAASVYYQKSWCPDCAGNRKNSLGLLDEFARGKGGRCVSETYRDARSPLQWQCKKGHEWEATSSNVVSKRSWCPYCAGQRGSRFTIEYMREIAKARGGDCLSDNYKNSKTPLQWICASGHEWSAMPLNVVNKQSWCARCAQKAMHSSDGAVSN